MGAAGDIISGVANVVGGFGRAAARRSAAKVAEYEAGITGIQADQQRAVRKNELNSTLSTIEAIQAARNVDPDSPTGRAIRASRRRSAREAIMQEQLGFTLQKVSKRSRAQAERDAAPFEIVSGFGRAAGDFSSAGAKMASMMKGGG
jgi:hypothetical protein